MPARVAWKIAMLLAVQAGRMPALSATRPLRLRNHSREDVGLQENQDSDQDGQHQAV